MLTFNTILTFTTILGFICTMVAIFALHGTIRIIAEPLLDVTLSYAYVVIIVFAVIFSCMLLYKLIASIIFSPMQLYDDYRKRQAVKHEKLCVLNYVKFIGLQDTSGCSGCTRVRNEYKESLEALYKKPVYWLLWFVMKQDVPEEYEYYIHTNKELLFAATYNKVNNLMKTQGYRQALESLLTIQDFAMDLPWFYEQLITCYLQMHDIEKAFGAYAQRKKQIGEECILESRIYLARAELDTEHRLQSLKKAYDLVKKNPANTCLDQQVVAVLSYLRILSELKDYKVAMDVIKYEINKNGWNFGGYTQAMIDVVKHILFDMSDKKTGLAELIAAEKSFVEIKRKEDIKDDKYEEKEQYSSLFKLMTAEVYIKLEMYDKAKPILISLLNECKERALCMLVYIESKTHGHHENMIWLQRIFE